MIDLAEKPSSLTKSPEVARGAYYPSIYIENKDLPFEDSDIGKTFDAKVKVKLRSISTSNTGEGDKKTYSIEIRQIEFQKDEKPEDYTRTRVKTKRIKSG